MPDNENGSIIITESNSVLDYTQLFGNNGKVLGYENQNFNSDPFRNSENQPQEKKDDKEDDIIKKGLFVKDMNGNKPDLHAAKFFNLLNVLAGGIFDYIRETGEIFRQKRYKATNVQPSNSVSRELAILIDNLCEDKARQVIFMRVGVHIWIPEPKDYDPYWRPSVAFDSFFTGHVDLADFEEVPDHVIRATLIYHFLFERNITSNYEINMKKGFAPGQYRHPHAEACKAEIKVLKEMGETVMTDARIEVEKATNEYMDYFFDWKGIKISFRHTYLPSTISNYEITPPR